MRLALRIGLATLFTATGISHFVGLRADLIALLPPTNNLDVTTTRALIDDLSSYRGALLIVSHDQHFLDELELRTMLTLDDDGAVRQIR